MTSEQGDDPLENINLLDMMYVKRPDLRPSELPPDVSNEKFEAQLQQWQWWITSSDLYRTTDEVHYLDMPLYPKHHGFTDPAEIIAYFCSCHEAGVYPPSWIMGELYNKFSKYLDDNLKGNSRRLGEYFGEPARGTRRGVFGKYAFSSTMELAMLDIDRFREWFGINRDDSISLVCQMIKAIDNQTSHRFEKGFAALLKEYKLWQKRGMSKYYRDKFKEKTPLRENKVAMIRRYPHDAFIAFPRLQEYLKD